MEEILHQLKYSGNAYIYIVSFLDGLFSGAMLVSGRVVTSWWLNQPI